MKARRPAHVAEWMKLGAAQREAWITLLRVHRGVTGRLDDALARAHGLTLAEWDVLVHLAGAEGSARMGDLADAVLLSASGLSRLVARLEARGLAERRRGADDARETYAAITPKGLETLAEAAPLHNAELRAHFLAALTASETETLAALLRKVAAREADCPRHPPQD